VRFLTRLRDAPSTASTLPTGQAAGAVERWSATLRGHSAHGVHLAAQAGAVYTGDGWGSTYPSMRIRRLDLRTGAETASFRAFNSLRCSTLIREGRSLIAILDDKILELDAQTLEERRRWDKRVPRYGQTVAFAHDVIVLANWLDPTVGLIDYASGRVRRRDAPPMPQIIAGVAHPLLVGGAADGGTYELRLPEATVDRVVGTPPILHATLSPDGSELWALAGIRAKVSDSGSDWGKPTSDLRMYHLPDGAESIFRLPAAASWTACGVSRLLVAGQRSVLAVPLPVGSDVIRAWKAPSDQEWVDMDADSGLVLTVRADLKANAAELTCWELQF
jgi:hypothetical protein